MTTTTAVGWTDTHGHQGWHLVDAAPYTDLLGELYRRGVTLTAIHRHCHVHYPTVVAVAMGERKHIQHRTAERLNHAVELLPPDEVVQRLSVGFAYRRGDW